MTRKRLITQGALALIATVALAATTAPTTRPSDALLSPYASNPEQLWNRLHRALFLRTAPDGSEHIHAIEPLLYAGGTYPLRGKPHEQAIALLDEFLASPRDSAMNPLKRLFFQHDLWAAFDNVAWYPDDWVHHSKDEPAAIELRTRLAKAICRLALSDQEIDSLPDNYAMAVKSKQFAPDYDPAHPERPFLPADLFNPNGTWVRFHDTLDGPMAQQHYKGCGGRSVHITFIRLPGVRAATENYLKHLNRESMTQFPPGTMVAMVRRALTVSSNGKVRTTPLTELVQMRVYRRIPDDPQANFHGDIGQQDVYEFLLDRSKLFTGEAGLAPVGADAYAESFARDTDPFVPGASSDFMHTVPALKTCTMCHQTPGVHSVLSLQRGLRADPKREGPQVFRTYDFSVELNYTVATKVRQFNWGLLQGLMEAERAARQPPQ